MRRINLGGYLAPEVKVARPTVLMDRVNGEHQYLHRSLLSDSMIDDLRSLAYLTEKAISHNTYEAEPPKDKDARDWASRFVAEYSNTSEAWHAYVTHYGMEWLTYKQFRMLDAGALLYTPRWSKPVPGFGVTPSDRDHETFVDLEGAIITDIATALPADYPHNRFAFVRSWRFPSKGTRDITNPQCQASDSPAVHATRMATISPHYMVWKLLSGFGPVPFNPMRWGADAREFMRDLAWAGSIPAMGLTQAQFTAFCTALFNVPNYHTNVRAFLAGLEFHEHYLFNFSTNKGQERAWLDFHRAWEYEVKGVLKAPLPEDPVSLPPIIRRNKNDELVGVPSEDEVDDDFPKAKKRLTYFFSGGRIKRRDTLTHGCFDILHPEIRDREDEPLVQTVYLPFSLAFAVRNGMAVNWKSHESDPDTDYDIVIREDDLPHITGLPTGVDLIDWYYKASTSQKLWRSIAERQKDMGLDRK